MDNFKAKGWILQESALKSIEASGSTKNLEKNLLDRDLREIGAGISDLHKGKFESIDHDFAVLQIMKIRNISAPKMNESSKTAPKLLKLQLTDGVNTYSAIEMESTALTMETKPGTKILVKIKFMKMANGQLLFTPKNIEILGGHVEVLVSKWEVSRSLAGIKGSRSVTAGGPPPFIPFGQKIQQNLPNTDKSFKSLQPSKPKESENDDSEFKAQRQDAIAEASKAGTKKTFGGGSKTLVDSNVQKIMDKGFTEEQATTALKYSRNNVEKALSNLKRREENRQRASSNDYEPREYSKEKRGAKGSSAEPQAAKPSGAVSLFDFLENKFPEKHDAKDERFENNISSSFRKSDKEIAPSRSQNWSAEQKSSQNQRSSGRDYREDFRNYRDSREGGSRESGRDYRDSRESKYQSKSSSSATTQNQYQKQSSNGNFNSARDQGKSKYPKSDYNSTKPDYNNTTKSKDYGNNYQAPSSNNFKSRNNNSKYYNEPQSNDYQKPNRNIVESMEKMNLKGSNHQQQFKDTKINSSNYPPLTPSTNEPPPKSYPTNPKSYPIVGFQNKEANEHAKSVLKTKNIPSQPPKPPASWQQQQPAPNPPPPQHTMPVAVIKNQPPPPFSNSNTGVAQPVPQPMQHSMPQPFVQHQPHPGVIHAVIPANPPVYHQPINYSAPIIMPPPGMAPPVVTTPQLKIGDLCLAKYWEDGQLYNAKITGISDSTYVVLFMDYGNAEEVRKTDCFPLIPACPTPPHTTNFAPPQTTYRVPTQQQKMPHQNYHQQPPMSSMPYKNIPGKNQNQSQRRN